MPHVSAEEAPNTAVIDAEATLRKLRPGRQRAPLVGSDALRIVLLRMGQDEEPHRPHRHPGADEAMLVMEGRGTFTVGTQAFAAGPGSLVYVPRGVIHRIQVTGPEPLAWLSIVAPNLDASDEAVDVEA